MRILRKGLGIALSIIVATANVAPVMAESGSAAPRVYVNFIFAGRTAGKFITQGSSTSAPEVPVVPGYVFCGWDKSLKNIQTNTTFNAVYVPSGIGDAAIAAKKASLGAPAITETTVADPNMVMPVPAGVPLVDPNAAILANAAAAAAFQAPAVNSSLQIAAAANQSSTALKNQSELEKSASDLAMLQAAMFTKKSAASKDAAASMQKAAAHANDAANKLAAAQ
ncbi:MAG: hypothetical protein J6P05_05205 [Lachnospiraceae bacterium]|nr:hypothetical protein [Lachnospiraceae bacterium]